MVHVPLLQGADDESVLDLVAPPELYLLLLGATNRLLYPKIKRGEKAGLPSRPRTEVSCELSIGEAVWKVLHVVHCCSTVATEDLPDFLKDLLTKQENHHSDLAKTWKRHMCYPLAAS